MKRASGRKHRKTILILSATVGAGHVRAGEALFETAKSLSPSISVYHEDILNFTFPLFKKLYNDLYFAVVNTAPDFWGYLYKRTEFKGKEKSKSPFIKLFDQFNYKKYLQALEEMQPDAVLCTHFLPYLAITENIQRSEWKIPFYVVTTDYDVHSLWINPNIAHYYVASEEAAWTIHSHRIEEKRISVTGIPIFPQFSGHNKPQRMRSQLGLSPNKMTIMILSGGYGTGVVNELVPSIAEFLSAYSRKEFQLLVVCGKNEKLFRTLQLHNFPKNISARLYQFIPYIDKLMDAADVLITKAGGLTISEALAKHLPMIIFDPIPGQEGRNAEYLTERGAALRALSLPNLHYKLKTIVDEPRRLKMMETNAKRIARPDAARIILEDLVKRLS